MKAITIICTILISTGSAFGAGDHGGAEHSGHKMPGDIPSTSHEVKKGALHKDLHEFEDNDKPLKRNGYFLDQEGNKVRIEDFKGKAVLIDFIYSACKTGHCMYMGNKMDYIKKKFPVSLGRELQLVSVSFDADGDNPESLKAFSKMWDADPANWSFLSGERGDIVDIAQKYNVMFRWDVEDEVFIHNMRTFLLDRNGKVAAAYRGVDYPLQKVVDDISRLLKK